MPSVPVRVGTAGWTLPAAVRERFSAGATHLVRYATRFTCVEINSTFYRPHRRTTYERWAASVPDGFAFSLKLPRSITHERRLVDAAQLVEQFVEESSALGGRRHVVLVQLPPSLAYDAAVVSRFFEDLRARYAGLLACEPRHATWFAAEPERVLQRFDVARVAADPAVVPAAAEPGGWDELAYYRLHGSPVTYASSYDDAALRRYAAAVAGAPGEAWCIFDNTRSGAAAADALRLTDLLAEPQNGAPSEPRTPRKSPSPSSEPGRSA